jgi:hypothetical protein
LSNPTRYDAIKKERLDMNNEQLELGINPDIRYRGTAAARRGGRITRASWWFTQMRTIVGRAMDWENAGQPRPEQIWIPGAHREVEV